MNLEFIELSSINAPYPIYKEKDRDIFYFKVNSTEYKIAFLSYDLEKLPIDSICITRDQKDDKGNKDVEQTIKTIIITLLDQNRVMSFTCETEDGKQFARQRLFKKWFNSIYDATQYEMLTIEDIGDVCGGAIISKKHPQFVKYIQMLNELKNELIEFKTNI